LGKYPNLDNKAEEFWKGCHWTNGKVTRYICSLRVLLC
jgi:hypothetical protein